MNGPHLIAHLIGGRHRSQMVTLPQGQWEYPPALVLAGERFARWADSTTYVLEDVQ